MMNKVIVSGANSYIGSRLIKFLLLKDIKVVAIVNENRTNNLNNHYNLEIISIMENKIENLNGYFTENDYDVFFHFAWAGSTGNNRTNYKMQISNIEMTNNYIELCNKINCKRFVGIGSLAEKDVELYINSDDSTPNPVSFYGIAKHAAFMFSKTLCNQYNIEHIWTILPNVYGENNITNNFINYMINEFKNNHVVEFTPAEQLYDFIYIDDAINGIYLASKKGVNNNTYFIGSGHPTQLKHFITQTRDIINPNLDVKIGAIPYNGISLDKIAFDISKAMYDLKYEPRTAFVFGLQKTFKANKNKE